MILKEPNSIRENLNTRLEGDLTGISGFLRGQTTRQIVSAKMITQAYQSIASTQPVPLMPGW